MMQRRVRQHHAELIIFGSDSRQFDSCAREDDGAGGRLQQCFGIGPEFDKAARDCDIFRHQGEGLFFAEFSGAHRTDRTSVLRVASEMVAAETFHRDNLARAKILRCFLNRCHIAARNLIASLIKVMRAARRARDGLRVKAPIRGICVFGGALSVERPRGHRGVRAIVGQGADDAVARAAIRAVNVRVVVAEIVRIEEFPQALFAYR